MALMTCPDCLSEVSDRATACPKCARPLTPAVAARDVSGSRASSTLVFAGVGFLVGMGLVWSGCRLGRDAFEPMAIMVMCLGGVMFAILGAILGAIVGSMRS
jgi:hypothetical protein